MLKTKCAEYHAIAADKQKPGLQTEVVKGLVQRFGHKVQMPILK